MADDDPRDQISQLEAQIEALAEEVERCRKIALISKAVIAAGALWMLAMTLGPFRFDPVAMIAAMTAIIGGIVAFGSNASTWEQKAGAMNDAGALRAELIGRLELRVVEGGLSGREIQ
ncbi:MAG TPA: hypothetical protein VGH49_08795 [Xanthobacteraceae bacterium]|jgi:hypothetical protein